MDEACGLGSYLKSKMTGKNRNWRSRWERLPDGSLRHVSGLVLRPECGEGYTDLNADETTLGACQTWLTDVRGTAPHDLHAALMRLMREAAEWHQANP